MTIVTPHFNPDPKGLQHQLEWFQGAYNTYLEYFTKPSPPLKNCGTIAKSFLTNAILACLQDSRAKCVSYAQIALEAITLAFKTSQPKGTDISHSIAGNPIRTIAFANTAYTDDETWAKGIFLAVLLGDRPALDYLLTIPEETFLKSNLKGHVEFDLDYTRLLRGLFNPQAQMADLLEKAMDSSFPDKLTAPRRDYVNLLKYPEVVLIRCLLSPDPAEFNEKLHEALLSHKEFWSAEGKAFNPEGWLSLPLTAIAHLAWTTKRWEISVESDYLPMWLVKGEW